MASRKANNPPRAAANGTQDKLEKLGALWLGTSRNGQKYFSGVIGEQRVVVFKNGYKNEPKHPDYIVYASQPQETVTPAEPSTTDDIPF